MLTDINPKLPMRDKSVTKEYYIGKLKFSEISDYGDYLLIRKDNVELVKHLQCFDFIQSLCGE